MIGIYNDGGDPNLRSVDAARIREVLEPGPKPTLRTANIARQAEWDQDNQITLTYRGNELAGEVGEACNVIKKLERERIGIRGSRATKEQLAEELADIVICADLIAMAENINLLDEAVPAKFNATSQKYGLTTRLDLRDIDAQGLAPAEWERIDAERVLYVDRGKETILCDRNGGPVTILVKRRALASGAEAAPSDQVERLLFAAHGDPARVFETTEELMNYLDEPDSDPEPKFTASMTGTRTLTAGPNELRIVSPTGETVAVIPPFESFTLAADAGEVERLPTGPDIASAIEKCDWSGAPIGNKVILLAALADGIELGLAANGHVTLDDGEWMMVCAALRSAALRPASSEEMLERAVNMAKQAWRDTMAKATSPNTSFFNPTPMPEETVDRAWRSVARAILASDEAQPGERG